MIKFVAVTACPTGIAHTYMVADALKKVAPKHGINIKVETQGALGVENMLKEHEIKFADLCIIISDIPISMAERFENSNRIAYFTINEALENIENVLLKCIQKI